jgi:hypothetical protein
MTPKAAPQRAAFFCLRRDGPRNRSRYAPKKAQKKGGPKAAPIESLPIVQQPPCYCLVTVAEIGSETLPSASWKRTVSVFSPRASDTVLETEKGSQAK